VITDFPKAQDSFTYEHIRVLCTKGLENCVQLRCCTWTRDGSLTSHILQGLGRCPELTDISINGRHSGHYEPGDLLQLRHLHKILLIFPSIPLLEILPSWFQVTGKSITGLGLTCVARKFSMDLLNALFIHRLEAHTYHGRVPGHPVNIPSAVRAS